MATQIHRLDEGRPPEILHKLSQNEKEDSDKEKSKENSPKFAKRKTTPLMQRKRSIASISRNNLRSKKCGGFFSNTVPSYHRKDNGNSDTLNLVGEDRSFTSLVEDNVKRFRDINKNNNTETTNSHVPSNQKTPTKNEKCNSLKNSFVPKLLNSLERINPNFRTIKSASNTSLNDKQVTRSEDKTINKNCDNSDKTKVVIDINNTVENSEKIVSKNSIDTTHKDVVNVNKNKVGDKSGESSTASSSRNSQEGDYTNYGLDKTKFRNSFHQNVEEALNSLLWQPYEYQKSNRNSREFDNDEDERGVESRDNDDDDDESFLSEGSRTPTWSSCSSDLDEVPFFEPATTKDTTKNLSISNVAGPLKNHQQHPSATVPTTTLSVFESSYLRSGEDLHSNVNNLPLGQSVGPKKSRDALVEHSTVAFEPVASLNLAGVAHVGFNNDSVVRRTTARRSYSSDRLFCDGGKNNRDRSHLSMNHLAQHNQGVQQQQPSAVTSGTVKNLNTSENGLKSYVDTSLNSVNIVGLPSHHARYASVPSSTTFQNSGATRSQSSTTFPHHVRNISEPATKYQQNFSTPLQGTSTIIPPNSVVPTHRHYPEHNHFRSHSAPKSMLKNEPPTSNNNSTHAGTQLHVNNLRIRPPNSQVNLATPNRFPVIQNSPQNSTSLQYQVVPNHQQINSTPNTSKFTVGVNSSLMTTPTHKPQSSLTSSSPATATQHPVPNPRLSKQQANPIQVNNNQQQNVSNVNVNFYRAVPVNVVSSVPTIHCLNTLSNGQGNSVSNVQVLPLGSTFQQPTNQTTNLTYSVSGSNNVTATNINRNTSNHGTVPTYTVSGNSAVTATNIGGYTVPNVSSANQKVPRPNSATQITLHNANAIQIAPSSGFHINRNSAFGPPNQDVSDTNRNPSFTISHDTGVSNRNSAFSEVRNQDADAGVNTMIVPLNEVVVQNVVRSISATNEAVPSGRLITTTAQINGVSNNSQPQIASQGTNMTRSRTFTSTEAQTDEILPAQTGIVEQNAAQKEQRRRERRERRNNRRAQRQNLNQNQTIIEDNMVSQNNERLPDILDSHLPPPYSAVTSSHGLSSPGQMVPQMIPNASSMLPPIPPQIVPPPGMVPGAMLPHGPMLQTVVPNGIPTNGFVFPAPLSQQVVQGQVPLIQGAQPVPVAVTAPANGFRFPFPANGFRRTRFSEDTPKGCCGFLQWKPGSLRWFIALIALVAVCCVLVGTALGAMRPAGRDHLTVSLLMIGVGIVLITVSGVAWRLTSHDSSTCRSMLGLGSTESVDVCTRRFVPRLPPSYGRPHHPYAAMMYPEFQYRPPPPSYQASMQEYRLRLLLLDRGNSPQIQAGLQNAVSPPPTYRSHAGSLLRAPLSSRRDASQSEYSCPPSYRSQNSSHRPGTLQGSILHSREHSLSVSDSNPGESVVNVVNILGSTEEDIALDNITLDSLKMEPEHELSTLKMLLKGSHSDLEGSKDGNLVTIVQTSDQNPVIVTVSGCSNDNHSSVQITEIPSEMEILAHL